MTTEEFNKLCEANSFGAVARGEFPLVPSPMLKALVEAAVSAESLKLNAANERIKRLEEAGDALNGDVKALRAILADMGANGTMGNSSMEGWTEAKEAKP